MAKISADKAREKLNDLLNDASADVVAWLNSVANGVKGILYTKDGVPYEGWVVPPDPAKAFELFMSTVDYSLPKLGRLEHTGEGGGAVQHAFVVRVEGVESNRNGGYIDVTPLPAIEVAETEKTHHGASKGQKQ